MFVLLSACYGWHIALCADSPLFGFPYRLFGLDMNVNLRWAESIIQQGWLNPNPPHPYNHWMSKVGSYEEWEAWWQNIRIFQQSPLYAYFLVPFISVTRDLIYIHIVQGLIAILLCYLISRIAEAISGRVLCGRIAFVLAAFYAPFFVYSWMILRDLLGWIILLALLLAMFKLADTLEWRAKRLWAGTVGALLGIGFLARETFLLIIPLTLLFYSIQFYRQKEWKTLATMASAVAIAISPLIIRNVVVGAPPLSSSNRFAENFIEGNAGNAHPYRFVIPPEMRNILETSGGKGRLVVVETLRTHPGVFSFVKLQAMKVISLFDPFESPDNINVYYVEKISPLVRWGIKHWMIFTPGLIGLFLSLWQRDRRHWPLWLMLIASLAGVFITAPFSRYRQSLALFWIPWAAYALVILLESARHQAPRRAAMIAIAMITGWILSLGPLARCPKDKYERSLEYIKSLDYYSALGQTNKVEETRAFIRATFPEEANW